MAEPPVLTRQDGPVAVLTLNRPGSHNALNTEVLGLLDEGLDHVLRAGTANTVVITGAGERTFCAGADLDELAGLDGSGSREVLGYGQQVMQRIALSPVPVLAAVNGVALGGGFELVLATTFPVLAVTASLGLPEAGLGLIPGYGGTQRLPQVVGRACAAHLMLTGDRLSAERAFQLGLTPVAPVPVGELLTTAVELAHRVATRGPKAVSAILEAMGTSSVAPAHLAFETSLAAMANASGEGREGIAAFKERRPARFPDRQAITSRGDEELPDEQNQ